tara:strand:- start:9462 stop:10481 length:1020 start_codon:yes stop_codon:yes gene_type:complete
MIQYRLIGKKQPSTYSVKIHGAMGLKDGIQKEIGYYKGYESPFKEDVIKLNKDAVPERPPLFTFKKHINATTIDVRESDKALINFMEASEDYGRIYERYSENIESTRQLSKYSEVEKALSIVNEGDEFRTKALGLCIIGFDSYGKDTIIITKELKELAFNNPKKVLNEYNSPNFDNKLLVSLAFCSNVIEANNNQTAIQWVNGKGRILGIATGEDSVTKMTEFIGSQTPESNAVMQELGKRLDKIISKKVLAQKEESKVKSLEEKIKELEAKLAGKEELSNIEVVSEPIDADDIDSLELKEAQSLYKQTTKRPIPMRYKNDLEWLTKQIKAEVLEEVED